MNKKNPPSIISQNREIEPSVLIISLNAEKTIGRTLKSIKEFKEIILVDNGSYDKTVKIARKYTDKIYKYPVKNLKSLRNYALSCADSSWVLFIDSDEILTKENIKRLKIIFKEKYRKYEGFWLARRNYYGDKEKDYLKYGLFYPDFQLRLFKKKYRYYDTPHETPDIVKEKTWHCQNVEIYHHSDRRKLFSLLGGFYLFPLTKIYGRNLTDKNISYLVYNAVVKFFDLFFISLTRGKGVLDGYYGILAAFNFACHISCIYLYAIFIKISQKND